MVSVSCLSKLMIFMTDNDIHRTVPESGTFCRCTLCIGSSLLL